VTDALVVTMMLATKILIDMENTDEKRSIIIKMLSEILPYETLVGVPNDFDGTHYSKGQLFSVDAVNFECDVYVWNDMDLYDCEYVKPYLRPMNTMTDSERNEYNELTHNLWYEYDDIMPEQRMASENAWNNMCSSCIEWLNKHHFDHHDYISKGLAFPAEENMYENIDKYFC
jgi:hypothetical protein